MMTSYLSSCAQPRIRNESTQVSVSHLMKELPNVCDVLRIINVNKQEKKPTSASKLLVKVYV